jgi:hypothetical protein
MYGSAKKWDGPKVRPTNSRSSLSRYCDIGWAGPAETARARAIVPPIASSVSSVMIKSVSNPPLVIFAPKPNGGVSGNSPNSAGTGENSTPGTSKIKSIIPLRLRYDCI